VQRGEIVCDPVKPRRKAGLPRVKHLTSGNSAAGLMVVTTETGQVFYWVAGAREAVTEIESLRGADLVAAEHLFDVCVTRHNYVSCVSTVLMPGLGLGELDFGDASVVGFPELSDAEELIVSSGGPCIRKRDASVWCQEYPQQRATRLRAPEPNRR
jgi:hypothetical protein